MVVIRMKGKKSNLSDVGIGNIEGAGRMRLRFADGFWNIMGSY
jgi:hypothetical protein